MSQKRDTNSYPDGFWARNTSELQELLQDEEKMDQMVRLNEKFQELQVDREMLLTTNRSLAEESLSHRPRLQNGKLQLAAKYEQLAVLTTACREKQSRLETHMQKHSPQTAQNLLQEEVARAEEQSEDLLEKFMEGQVPLEGFLESFQSFRKMYHIRRAQVEKMQEFNRPARKHRKAEEEEEEEEEGEERKKKLEQREPRPNGIAPHAPPRVFQVRYGLTPAILVPASTHFPLPTSVAAPHAASLPPLDSRSSQSQASGPAGLHSCPGQPVGLRVIGQIPSWSGRPVRLQQLYRPSPHQTEPPYR
ncbi:vacuolar protein sorting-associated protein 37D [Chanos chanos]|uniref:Vacuolar protein sorting-associated protein 37D n=1 Tax=Chanos chanos TaxID=29144 RepID=A0A6J2WXU0_CHACN|nr:vacuolar protein sorting-associated protein 37D-like [Chanos chanos]